MSEIRHCSKHDDGYFRWSVGDECPMCQLKAQLTAAQEDNKRLAWFVMSMRDVFAYNEYHAIDMDVLFECLTIADCAEFTKGIFGEIEGMLIKSGLALLPTSNKAIRLYGTEEEKQSLPEAQLMTDEKRILDDCPYTACEGKHLREKNKRLRDKIGEGKKLLARCLAWITFLEGRTHIPTIEGDDLRAQALKEAE